MPKKKRETKIEQPEINNFQIKPENRAAKRWLWIGVCGVTAIIVLIWGWSFKEQITNLNWHKNFESDLISGGKNDWNKLFQSEPVSEEKNIKSQLTEIIERIDNISTTTSTTLNP